jgi:protein disulfide-isomerase
MSIERASPPIEPPASAAPSSAKPPPTKATAIVWETSEVDARDRARRTGKPLLVYFRAAWATAALQMERSVWTDPGIIALVERFVPLRIDVTDAEGDAEAFAQTYGITSVPEIVIHGPMGRSVTAIPGAPAVEPLTAILRRALDDD